MPLINSRRAWEPPYLMRFTSSFSHQPTWRQ